MNPRLRRAKAREQYVTRKAAESSALLSHALDELVRGNVAESERLMVRHPGNLKSAVETTLRRA